MQERSEKKALDYIINEMIDVVENSKDEIFDISESVHEEYDRVSIELEKTKKEVAKHISEGDTLEEEVHFSRKNLSNVSKNFNLYSEEEVRKIYDDTHQMQTKLAILRKEEKLLRKKRDSLERGLIKLEQTVNRATELASKTSVILNYLYDDFMQVNEVIADAREKQAFSLKIIEAQEEERKKISREMHDGPAQMLANISLRSELIERTIQEKEVDHSLVELQNLRQMILTSLQEVRRIIYDLRPMALDDLGLIPTLKKYITTTSDYHHIKIDFITLGEHERLYQRYEIALFRLIQESLQNAIQHAEASLIKVKFEAGKDYLTVVIDDNGKGFDTSKLLNHSFGLVGMRERVEMLGGKIEITSKLGKGTRVYINLPYLIESEE